MLRINGKLIWNIFDLNKEFSAIEIYGQRKEFLAFSKVHCMVLSARLTDGEGESYEACFLTKEFWYKILGFSETECTGESWLDFFVEKRIAEELGESYSKSEEKSVRDEIENEIRDAFIREKLDYIINNSGIKDSNEDKLKALVLLAICEIAEADARNQSFLSDVAEEIDVQSKDKVQEIIFDDEKRTLLLDASKTHYCFNVFEDDVLPKNSKIRTVRLEAVASVNKYDNAILDFYNKDREIISTATIRPGEYRYINVADNKVIGFLPSVSIENGCCVYRNGYSSRNVKIAVKDSKPRTVSKTEYECFASAGKNAGALFVCNGKIVTDYCDVPLDYRTKLIFDMIVASVNVVEIACVSDSVKVLSDTGRVYTLLSCNSNSCGWLNVSVKTPDEENVVALRKDTRINKELKASDDVLETAVSVDGSETASLLRSGECRINYK